MARRKKAHFPDDQSEGQILAQDHGLGLQERSTELQADEVQPG
jgi:hypothetical protein